MNNLLDDNATIFSKDDQTNYEQFITEGTQVYKSEVQNANSFATATPITKDEWFHVVQRYSNAGTADNPALQIQNWINGVLDATPGTSPASGVLTNANPMRIGANQQQSNDLLGNIKECIYFDAAIPDEEIVELYLCGVLGTADGDARAAAYTGAACSSGVPGCCAP
jgi:hypothetical protein